MKERYLWQNYHVQTIEVGMLGGHGRAFIYLNLKSIVSVGAGMSGRPQFILSGSFSNGTIV